MAPLSEPSRELARRILGDVEFENRLVAFRLHPRMGPAQVTLYSFGELADFFHDPFPQLEIGELEQWMRKVIGDVELAEKIRSLAGSREGEREKLERLRRLLETRLVQCLRIG